MGAGRRGFVLTVSGKRYRVSVVPKRAGWAAIAIGDLILVRDTGDHEINRLAAIAVVKNTIRL
jgi:hypothetical protein